MIKVEFHCHTRFSKDSLVDLPDLLRCCDRKGIDRLAITDHNTIAGAFRAVELSPARFIISEEIMTEQGELLAFFIKEEVPPGLPARQTIDLLRSQGAFISVSHPFDRLRKGHWRESDLMSILPFIDAIEMFNARCLIPQDNLRAIVFAQQHHLLGTVGSDAHHLSEIGAATLTMPEFSDSASLKRALSLAEPHTHMSPPWVHFYSRYAAWRKRKSTPEILKNVH
jgi:predicted metal-dependent phosphoesterase TrpH